VFRRQTALIDAHGLRRMSRQTSLLASPPHEHARAQALMVRPGCRMRWTVLLWRLRYSCALMLRARSRPLSLPPGSAVQPRSVRNDAEDCFVVEAEHLVSEAPRLALSWHAQCDARRSRALARASAQTQLAHAGPAARRDGVLPRAASFCGWPRCGRSRRCASLECALPHAVL
jgi:hypothetical protein